MSGKRFLGIGGVQPPPYVSVKDRHTVWNASMKHDPSYPRLCMAEMIRRRLSELNRTKMNKAEKFRIQELYKRILDNEHRDHYFNENIELALEEGIDGRWLEEAIDASKYVYEKYSADIKDSPHAEWLEKAQRMGYEIGPVSFVPYAIFPDGNSDYMIHPNYGLDSPEDAIQFVIQKQRMEHWSKAEEYTIRVYVGDKWVDTIRNFI